MTQPVVTGPKSNTVLVSFPKSGRTWMRYVFHQMNVDVWFTHAGYGTRRSNILNPKVFDTPDISRLSKKNIFMYRNALDTAVSLYFQIHKHELFTLKKRFRFDYLKSALAGRLPPKNINEFVLHPLFGVENICKFNRAWLDIFAKRHDTMVITYEDAKEDLASVIHRLVSFLDIKDCDVNEVVKKSTFAEMKQLEMKQESKELRLHGLRSEDPDTMKVRKGVVKGYTEYLDQHTIAEAQKIAARYGFEI